MLRNKDVVLCGVGAEARMLIYRYDVKARDVHSNNKICLFASTTIDDLKHQLHDCRASVPISRRRTPAGLCASGNFFQFYRFLFEIEIITSLSGDPSQATGV